MIKACEDAKVPLYVAYYRRALPNILKVKELIKNGLLGDIRFVSIMLKRPPIPAEGVEMHSSGNWRIVPEIAGGGYFYDLASHQLDALDFILGPMTMAEGYALNQTRLYAAEDITTGSFLFENGILGTGTWAFNTSRSATEEVTTIVGSKGKLSFPFFGDHSVKLEVDGMPVETFRFSISEHIQKQLIRTVVDDILGIGHCPSTGTSAARTNRIMEQLCRRIDI
jgi:predicted dehydrogenase